MFLLLPIVFISGVLTVFSPCVLPILPIVLASGIDGNINRIRGAILGLIFSFTTASLLLATFVRVMNVPADTVRLFAVILLIIFSISLIFPSVWELIQVFIEKFWRFQPKKVAGGFFGGFLTGISLGIVWTPCIGPIVATVATLAAVSSINLLSIIIVLTYAIGTGLPLYFIAKGGKSVSERVTFLKQKNQKVRQIFGIIVLASALFIWSGADRAFQAWTISNLPEFWTQLPSTFENIFNVEPQF